MFATKDAPKAKRKPRHLRCMSPTECKRKEGREDESYKGQKVKSKDSPIEVITVISTE